MTWPCRTVAAACVLLGLASPSRAGQVKLEIRDGLVTLDARDATVREIVAEWARVGQTRVINAESLSGGPITIQLNNVPERKALDILLRSIAGFVAAPRAVAQRTASVYDHILLMPGARPAVVPTAGNPSSRSMPGQPQPQRERFVQQPNIVVDDEDEPFPSVQMPLPGQPPGAPQPGMMTPGSQNQRPNQQGPASQNPYGLPYGNPYPPNAAGPGSIPQPATPLPQAASRPGMPTAPPPVPVKPPDPIIRN